MRRRFELNCRKALWLSLVIASTAMAQNLTIPQAFLGTWSGTVNENTGAGPYRTVIRLSAGTTGEVDYVGPACGSSLTFASAEPSRIVMRERMTRGTCADGATVTLTLSGTSMAFLWAHPSAPTFRPTGTFTRDASTPATGPVITSGGVVNAASFQSKSGLAQGAIATAFGSRLGPAEGISASAYPLQKALGGVTVRLTQGANVIDAIPIFVAAGQVNFIVPSQARLGPNDVTITYNGQTSPPQRVEIVATAFALFTFERGTRRVIAQNFVSEGNTPLNLPETPASPGQTLIVYGTGLGPITAPEDIAAPAGDLSRVDVEILVGGVAARRVYAGRSPCCTGLDQIVFQVPESAPRGCSVPLVIRAGGVYSNAGDISTARAGTACSTTPFEGFDLSSCREGSVGSVSLFRTSVDQGLGSTAMDFALGSGYFLRRIPFCPGGVPQLTTAVCTVHVQQLGGTTPAPAPDPNPIPPPEPQPTESLYMDAGAQLTVSGPEGDFAIPRIGFGNVFSYSTSGDITGTRAFLNGGRYTLRGPGGRDVGPFEATFDFQPTRMTSPASGSAISKNGPVTINWTGGSASDLIGVAGTSVDTTTNTYGYFSCFVPPGANTFTVPAWILSQLPDSSINGGSIGVGSYLGYRTPIVFSATGLDYGSVFVGSGTYVLTRYTTGGQ